ncbi:hypothetical protein R1sor_022194 [Riccia sorocarpa]|uniref:Uncharacterized protein n=1 Tax=Riccia sorocarpa TaxID=122646 RepID=A0ABD3GJW4_9MARC
MAIHPKSIFYEQQDTSPWEQNWKERNTMQFRGITERLPASILIEEVRAEINALQGMVDSSDDWKEALQNAEQSLQCWRHRFSRDPNRLTQQDDNDNYRMTQQRPQG